MAKSLLTRNEIVSIAESGLVLQIDGAERVAPWSTVMSVSAVMALADRTSDRRVPVFVIGITDGAEERFFIIGEPDPIWERLTLVLADALPGIPPLDIWRAELAARGQASLYSRAAGVQ